jgi:hypothetical protein
MTEPRILTSPEQITPEWLTTALRASGVLDQGAIESIEAEASTPTEAWIVRLRVAYTANVSPAAPSRLIAKISRVHELDNIPDRGRYEIAFYQAAAGADLPVPRPYDARYDGNRFHVLMDDLSATHHALPLGFLPDARQSEQAIDALAAIHAHFWNRRDQTAPIGDWPTAEALRADHEADARRFSAFVDAMGDRLSETRRLFYERVLDKLLPRLIARLDSGAPITLCHGDPHHWNFLYPRRADQRACLLDWEALHIGAGTDDPAYQIGLFWFPERRARYERDLIRRYHDALLANDVHDYSWDSCWDDYRLSMLRMLFMPLFWFHETRLPADLWLARLERVILAVEDLRCLDVI